MPQLEIDLSQPINPFGVWERRAHIPGLRSVMSLGLNEQSAELESANLKKSIFKFLGPGALLGKNVLEIGTGIGRFTQDLADLSASLTSIDLSHTMLERARQSMKTSPNVNFLKASASSLPFEDRSFDYIFEVTVLLHMPDEKFQEIIRESKRVLKPGGKLFLCGPLADSHTQIHQYVVHRTLGEYKEALFPFKVEKTANAEDYTMLLAGK